MEHRSTHSGHAEQIRVRAVPPATIARQWTRIGLTGFGGPPAHIALLRRLVVEQRQWLDAREFEDANAACGLLPGPASTQLAILCAYRVGGVPGAIAGGLGFVAPAVAIILALAALFLSHSPPLWVRAAGAGASSAVAAVAIHAARGLIEPSFTRVRASGPRRLRWVSYVLLGGAGASLLGAYLVLVLIGCGLIEVVARRHAEPSVERLCGAGPALPAALTHMLSTTGGLGALAWTAVKVGALSFGGGFVIVPLMQGDAVHTYHWMSNSQFLNAVALGQVTPGPVVATVAAVGYAAHGLAGGLLAALIAFAPSFLLIAFGARHFDELRGNRTARAFLDGAGPAAIGAILGAAVLLATGLREPWQFVLLAGAAGALLLARRGVVETLIAAGAIGVLLAAVAGAPLP